jgi:hypothetical protein
MVRLELVNDTVKVLEDSWDVEAFVVDIKSGSTRVSQFKVSAADAEKLADLSHTPSPRITIQGKVKRVDAMSQAGWQPPYSIWLHLTDVRIPAFASAVLQRE